MFIYRKDLDNLNKNFYRKKINCKINKIKFIIYEKNQKDENFVL